MEGLSVRVLIAVILGAGALAIMLPLLDDLDQESDQELTITLEDETVTLPNGPETVETEIRVESVAGEPVNDARVILSNGSATLSNGPLVFHTGNESSTVTVSIQRAGESCPEETTTACIGFRGDQSRGSIALDVTAVSPENDFETSGPESTTELVVAGG